MENFKIKATIVMMAAVLVVGSVSLVIPPSFAQQYYQEDPYAMEDPYAKDPYAKDPYAKDHRDKSTGVNIQKIKCVNDNVNVNGIEITQIPENGVSAAEAQANEDGVANGNGLLNGDGINFDRNLVNVCVNVNVNEQIDSGEEPSLPIFEICDNDIDDDGDGEVDEPECIIRR